MPSFAEKFEGLIASRPRLTIGPSDSNDLSRLRLTHPDGADVLLTAGDYHVSQIFVPSNTRIRGPRSARIVQKPKSNCHLFTTQRSAANIWCEGFSVEGNASAQEKSEGAGLAFACGFYFKFCRAIVCRDLAFANVRQTAIHFVGCIHAIAKAIDVKGAGWSGVSSCYSANVWIEATIEKAGQDVMHSAVHIDGGTGVYVDADATDTTGNGIMLGSMVSPLVNCAVKGKATRCKRGLALVGSHEHILSNVAASGYFCDNNEVGVLVSNASSVVLFNSEIRRNPVGLLCQGKNGAKNVVVTDTDLRDNGVDVEEKNKSSNNWRFADPFLSGPDLPPENASAILRRIQTPPSWFD